MTTRKLIWADKQAFERVIRPAQLAVFKERGLCKSWYKLGRVGVYLRRRWEAQGDYTQADHVARLAQRSNLEHIRHSQDASTAS